MLFSRGRVKWPKANGRSPVVIFGVLAGVDAAGSRCARAGARLGGQMLVVALPVPLTAYVRFLAFRAWPRAQAPPHGKAARHQDLGPHAGADDRRAGVRQHSRRGWAHGR